MSKCRLFLLAVLLVALPTGCDTFGHTQYVIPNASPTDRATIKHIVESSATTAGLVDKTATSRVPDTIAFYVEPVPYYPVNLGARMVGDSAVVDITGFWTGPAVPPAFKTADSRVSSALTNEFGARLRIPDYAHIVPVQ